MNFEDKVLALFDNGRRSAVYVAGYQSARAQAASIAAEADRLIAEMAVENAELKEQLAAKDAELERVRKTLIEIRRSDTSTAGVNGVYAEMIDAALASTAAELVPSETGYACERNLSGKTVGNRCTACMCEEVKAGPRQGDIEYQIREQAHD